MTENKEKVLYVIDARYLACSVICAFVFGTFPIPCDLSRKVSYVFPKILFPKIRMSLWHVACWQSAFPNEEVLISWSHIGCLYSLPIMADLCPNMTSLNVELGREAWNWLSKVDRRSTSGHCQQVDPDILHPSEHHYWSRIKSINPNNADEHHYERLV